MVSQNIRGPDPRAVPLKWGILGTGYASQQFVKAIDDVPGCVVQAVGSRSRQRAKEFASSFSIPEFYGTYEAVVKNQAVDAIYIGTETSLHFQNASVSLEAGKPTLCEKPLTESGDQTRHLIDLAQRQGIFFMEGVWTFFFPAMLQARKLIEEGEIGQPTKLFADFGFKAEPFRSARVTDPTKGGGALFEVGVYGLHFAQALFGPPDEIRTHGCLSPSGVEHSLKVTLDYRSKAQAQLSCSIEKENQKTAVLEGSNGKLTLPCPWWKPRDLAIEKNGSLAHLPFPHSGSGRHFEIEEVLRCLRSGLVESPHMPWQSSLAVANVVDQIRSELRLVPA